MANPSGGAAGVWNPTKPFGDGQPDHTSLYAYLPLTLDQGGVHINSGIPNKAAYLIAQGGTFNGVTVTGIGRNAMGAIYYRTLTQYLTPATNFIGARNASIQACADLYGSGHANCTSVRNGFAAVGIGASTFPLANKVFLPVVIKNPSCNPTGINGRVTQNGAPASGVTVMLRYCNGNSCSTRSTTTTNSTGCYYFSPSSLSGDAYYYVRYDNPSNTYNNRLYMWISDLISLYTAGNSVSGGNFDIADVVLGSPASTNPTSLPITFNWNIRNTAELYQWEMFDFDGYAYASNAPEYGRRNFTLTRLPDDFYTYSQYCWDAIPFTSDGYGVPYYCNGVKFSSYSLLSEPSTEQTTRTPNWQIHSPDDFKPRQ
jgi:hypothetical protein